MHIVYMTNGRIPSRTANSVQSVKVCAGFVEAGHRVTMIVPRFERVLPTREQLEQQYGVPVEFRIVWLRGYRTIGRVAWEARALARALRERGDLYFTINMRHAAALSRLGRATVLELHDPPARKLDARALRMLPGSRGLRAFVCVSTALRRILAAQVPGFEDGMVLVEPNGVDLARFRSSPTAAEARRTLGWSDAGLTVGYAGHLYEGRGFDMILKLAEHYRDAQFRVMGGEPAAVEQARALVQSKGLANVDLLGFIPNAQLPAYMHACDVLVMPYARQVRASGGGETAAFANPMKMFEYMAAGRAIISSSLPGILETLNDSNALLCDPEDERQWIDALGRCHDPGLRERLGEQARRDVQRFGTDQRAMRIIAAAFPG